MNRLSHFAVCFLASSAALAGFSCTKDKEPAGGTITPPTAVETATVAPGIAGGSWEEKLTLTGKVTSIDLPRQRVQFLAPDGGMLMYTAEPGVRNLDQLKAGDVVTATAVQRLVVYVDESAGQRSALYVSAVERAPKGAKPGATTADMFELVATVTAIDPVKRTATLQFVDNSTKVVPVRADVDLSRYTVGDKVVIRASTTITAITKPAS